MSLSINFIYNYPQVAREAGFKLRQYKDGPLDWRLLGALDLERIQRDQYFEQVDGVLGHIAEVPLANMLETNILDSGIAKYFMLSQYAVQYLLFCRKFLDETVADLREAYAASQMEVVRLKKSQVEANNEILQLHKKITQMEAIHEVVYPCHLCSKSFVSNDALNIHLGRKHQATKCASDAGGRLNTSSQVHQRQEKVDDLHLINTIKLELEIKQLKERLNIAEREIRDRTSAANSKRATPREQQQIQQPQPQQRQLSEAVAPPARVLLKSVGIQSNLIKLKEQDETSCSDSRGMHDGQLSHLLDKVREFDEWRESLRTHNDASIAEINKKLNGLTQALTESVRAKPATVAPPPAAASEVDERASVTNFEQILMEKVTEIGRASAAKLEQVVYQMEINYKDKLDELEREIKRRNVVQLEKTPPKASIAKPVKSLQRTQTLAEQHSDSDESLAKRDSVQIHSMHETKQLSPVEREPEIFGNASDGAEKMNELKTNEPKINDTFEIVDLSISKVTQAAVEISNMLVLGSLSTEESNQTFVKTMEPPHAKPMPHNENLNALKHIENTDISESLDDESSNSSGCTTAGESICEDVEDGWQDRAKLKVVKVAERVNANKTARDELPHKSEKPISKRELKPIPFTRKDAKKLTQRKLQHLAIEPSTKTLSSFAMRKSNAALTEDRNKLKQKYPNFYATRNKLKKVVDKLCSAKLPPNAEVMLKTKEPLQPMERPYSVRGDSFELPTPKSSTPKDEHGEKDLFKQRLENILASPMRRPLNANTTTMDIPAKSVIPTRTSEQVAIPVPVPRKRVMFNTDNVREDTNGPNKFAF